MIYAELSEKLSIKSKEYDEEDEQRMRQIGSMIVSDLEQTMEQRKAAEKRKCATFSEDNPLTKGAYENADPGAIRVFGAVAVAGLAARWKAMKNPIQRKAEMLAVMACEGAALKYSMDHNFLGAVHIPSFAITLFATKF